MRLSNDGWGKSERKKFPNIFTRRNYMKPRTDPNTLITRAVPEPADLKYACRTLDNVKLAAHCEKDLKGETLADDLKVWIENHPLMPARKRAAKRDPNQSTLPFDPDQDKEASEVPAGHSESAFFPPAGSKRRPRAAMGVTEARRRVGPT
jgi:hypothetical protein